MPPSLGFGFYDRNNVPAGSVLIFDIKILKISTPEDEILAYLAENELEAQKSETGLYYIINKQGEGAVPTANSNVTVAYKGYFTNGTVFDQSDNGISFNLSQVIKGWQEGITYFNEGGEGILLIPPYLGYGYTDRLGIPAGSVLIFEIKLVKINN
ncbi:peptidylprolyl isomerase [Lutibacter sp. HS1-25]|nr:peptidylprolyl isomerase [Lutibacter sp. HS1-25]